jgi:lipopolysaccharide transport system permease protein
MEKYFQMSVLPITRIRPAKRWNGINLRLLWKHRDLLRALVRRLITVRYQQTMAGVLWVIGQPLLTTLIMSLFLSRLVGQSSGELPFPLYVYVGLLPWAYFTHALTKATICFVEFVELVTRVFLPRLLIPLAIILAAFVDFGVACLVLPILMIVYGVMPSFTLLALPFLIVLMVASTFGIGLWFATLNAEYRDLAFALPYLLQLGLFITPIFYSSDIVPLPLRWLYMLNPMVGVVEGMRWSLLNFGPPPILSLMLATLGTLLILASGLYIFQQREPNMADVI